MTNGNRPILSERRQVVICFLVGLPLGFASLLIAFGLTFGHVSKWNAEQWGPVAAWLSGAVTLTAVGVALRQANIARAESARLEIARLVDHEASRRRECIKAIADLWAAFSKTAVEFSLFEYAFDNMPASFDPKRTRTPEDVTPDGHVGELYIYEYIRILGKFYSKWIEIVQPPLFYANAILHGTELFWDINRINAEWTKLTREDSPGTIIDIGNKIESGNKPDVRAFTKRFGEIYERSDEFLTLMREHLSLELDDIERAVRAAVARDSSSGDSDRDGRSAGADHEGSSTDGAVAQ